MTTTNRTRRPNRRTVIRWYVDQEFSNDPAETVAGPMTEDEANGYVHENGGHAWWREERVPAVRRSTPDTATDRDRERWGDEFLPVDENMLAGEAS